MRPLLAFALLLLAACGGSDSKALTSEGYAALGKGDAKAALSSFDAALAEMSADHAEYARASLGRCQALAKSDGAAARQAFLDLAAKAPGSVREDDYGLICSRLLNGGFRMDAMDIIKAGDERYPTSAKMKETRDAVIEAAEREALPEELQKLATLGYAGGGK